MTALAWLLLLGWAACPWVTLAVLWHKGYARWLWPLGILGPVGLLIACKLPPTVYARVRVRHRRPRIRMYHPPRTMTLLLPPAASALAVPLQRPPGRHARPR